MNARVWRITHTVAITWISLFYVLGVGFFPFIATTFMEGTRVSRLFQCGMDRYGGRAFTMVYWSLLSLLHISYCALAKRHKAGCEQSR